MQRREFLAASAAAAVGLMGSKLARAADSAKELIELRVYTFDSAEKLKAFDEFLSSAAIPALNRAGISPVGVFRMQKSDNPKVEKADEPKLWVLLPHKSAESFITMVERLGQDSAFTGAGGSVLEAPKSSPAYTRFESSLFLGFDNCPKVEVPTKAPGRVLQLRIYESHSEERGIWKIHMFNEGGEIEIFRRTGLNPVFFGQGLIGSKLPNLTYMLSFEDEKAMAKGWDTFGKDPAWVKLRNDELYKDTVSNITNLVLRPASSSQI